MTLICDIPTVTLDDGRQVPLITLQYAREIGAKRYCTGELCPHGHLSDRTISSRDCVACMLVRLARYKRTHPDKIAANEARYKKTHSDKKAAAQMKRIAAKLQRTPPWYDVKKNAPFFAEAAKLKLAVDHIVPMQGEFVSGLNVFWNLQTLTKPANSSKGNRHDPDEHRDYLNTVLSVWVNYPLPLITKELEHAHR